jgi:hypothetical protein
MPIKSYPCPSYPPKQKTVFQVLKRTVWTINTAFKLGMAQDARCLRYEETDNGAHLLPKYGI